MDEEWRTTVTLSSGEDASRIYQQLGDGDSHGLAATGCSVSREGGNVFVYGESREQIDGAAGVIAATIDELGLSATTVTTDKWLADDARWGDLDAAPGDSDGEGGDKPKQGWLSSIVDGLLGGGPAP